MRTFLILLAVVAAAVAAATLGGRTEPATAAIPGCAQGEPEPRRGRAALDRHRQPRLSAVVRRRREDEAVEDQRPEHRQGLRVGGGLRGRDAARLHPRRGRVGLHAVQPGDRARTEGVRLRHQPDLVHAGSRQGAHVQRLVLQRQPVGRRAQEQSDLEGALAGRPARTTSSAPSSARRATSTS